ncbi:MAG: hypothetical protein Kow00108_00010 [Calditrichia bacterium]
MKKIMSFTILCLFWISSVTFSQNMSYSEFKVGLYNPKDAKAGWMFSYGTGKTIDEAFAWMIDFGLYAKKYSKTTNVADTSFSQINENTVVKELDFSTYLLPIMFKITFDRRIAPRSPLMMKGSAGIGYQFMWNKEQNYGTGDKESRFYHGFTYQLSFGAGFEMSSSAVLFGEVFYHGGKVKRNKTETVGGLPVWKEVDMSGPGIRVGINFVNFGLF